MRLRPRHPVNAERSKFAAMQCVFIVVALLGLMGAGAAGAGEFGRAGSQANPVRRVIQMLQLMQKKVLEEGKEEKELYEKYMCYCKTGASDLGKSIGDAETKIPQVTKAIEEAKALSKQLESEIAEHKADRAEAKETVAKSTGLRQKEAAEFAKFSTEHQTNILALRAAIAAIEKGAYGSFLQTAGAAKLRKLTIDMDMSSMDRDIISAFLAQGHSEGYVPQSGQIVGILKQMQDTMETSLKDAIAAEEQAIADYKVLMGAKAKEIAANQVAIESKTERLGETNVEIVNLEEDLDDTSKALAEDKVFLADLEKNCAKKTAEWEARSKTRTEELLALADTIKILSDDDALELFKKSTAELISSTDPRQCKGGQAAGIIGPQS